MKRIALCISGQPRTWKKCYKTWFNMFEPYGQVDIFCYMWDYNSDASLCAEWDANTGIVEPKSYSVSNEEQEEFITSLNPKVCIFSSKKETINRSGKVNKIIAEYAHSQFYALRRVAMLKRSYEVENDFEYDIVVRLRADQFFPNGWHVGEHFGYENMHKFFNEIKPSSVYTVQNMWDNELGVIRINDCFFLSDSLTFDHMSMIHDSFGYIDANDARVSEQFPPEMFLYFYIASIGVINRLAPLSELLLMRNYRHVARIGKIENYETS